MAVFFALWEISWNTISSSFPICAMFSTPAEQCLFVRSFDALCVMGRRWFVAEATKNMKHTFFHLIGKTEPRFCTTLFRMDRNLSQLIDREILHFLAGLWMCHQLMSWQIIKPVYGLFIDYVREWVYFWQCHLFGCSYKPVAIKVLQSISLHPTEAREPTSALIRPFYLQGDTLYYSFFLVDLS